MLRSRSNSCKNPWISASNSFSSSMFRDRSSDFSDNLAMFSSNEDTLSAFSISSRIFPCISGNSSRLSCASSGRFSLIWPSIPAMKLSNLPFHSGEMLLQFSSSFRRFFTSISPFSTSPTSYRSFRFFNNLLLLTANSHALRKSFSFTARMISLKNASSDSISTPISFKRLIIPSISEVRILAFSLAWLVLISSTNGSSSDIVSSTSFNFESARAFLAFSSILAASSTSRPISCIEEIKRPYPPISDAYRFELYSFLYLPMI